MVLDSSKLRWQAGRIGLRLAAILAVMVTLVSHLHWLWWPFWIIQHLRIQLVIALLVLLPLLLLCRWWRMSLLLLAALLLNAVPLVRFYVDASVATSLGQPTLSITHLNVDKDKSAALDYLNESGEDILFLQELTPALVDSLERLTAYEAVLLNPLNNTHGSGMLLHREWAGEVLDAEIIHLPAEAERPLLKSRIRVADRTVTLISFHATRPSNWHRHRGHTVEIDALAAWTGEQTDDLIVIGDFNATPWSSPIRKLEAAGLVASMRGFGLQGTWLARLPAPLRIPIDLCLHSPTWQTVERQVGPNLGSDHLPLHVMLYER